MSLFKCNSPSRNADLVSFFFHAFHPCFYSFHILTGSITSSATWEMYSIVWGEPERVDQKFTISQCKIYMKDSEPEWTNPKSSIGNCMNCAKMQYKTYIPYEHVVRNVKFLNAQPMHTSQWETVWWTKSNSLGLFPQSSKDQWNCNSISLTTVKFVHLHSSIYTHFFFSFDRC